MGVYSTPHLVDYNERVRINGLAVPDKLLVNSFAKIDEHRENTSLSYFEFGTLAALDIFQQQMVDVQLLEVGLGGRLDAVNIVDADAALITTISVDHIDWLGSDVSQIALEKAGVFRPRQIAVCGDASVPKTLIKYANDLKTDLLMAGEDFSFQVNDSDWQLVASHDFAGLYLKPVLNGVHQIQNAAAVIHLLAHISANVPVKKEAIEAGLKNVSLSGRLQRVGSKPAIYLDVAHNEESAMVLAAFVKSQKYTGKVHAVFSILKDKQLEKVMEPLIGLVSHWHIAPLRSCRSISSKKLEKYLRQDISQPYSVYENIADAFAYVRKNADEEDLVICFGSFYVVEDCLGAL